MFDFEIEPHPFAEPWLQSSARRTADFYRRPRRVAYYSEESNDSSFRFRVYNMAAAINAADIDVSASWFLREDGPLIAQVVPDADVFVVHRSGYTAELDHLIQLARSNGIPVLFDCDDLVFDTDSIPMLLRSLAQPMTWTGPQPSQWDYWFAMIGRMRAVAQRCDGFLGSTQALADAAASIMDKPTTFVRNFLSPEEIAYSQQLVDAREASGNHRDGRLDLGYFSGSPTHVNDLGLASESLRRIMSQHPQVRVTIVGYMSIAEAGLSGFEDQVIEQPFADYVNLQRLIARTEINIAPLQDNVFTRCKSELKWFDAGIVAIPSLISPTLSITRSVNDGVDAVLVADDEWEPKLQQMIADYDEAGPRIGQAARERVLDRYQPDAVVPDILAALGLS